MVDNSIGTSRQDGEPTLLLHYLKPLLENETLIKDIETLGINLEGVPLWLICVIFLSVVVLTSFIVIIACICERRRRIQRAQNYQQEYQDDEISWMRSQMTPRAEGQEGPEEYTNLVVDT